MPRSRASSRASSRRSRSLAGDDPSSDQEPIPTPSSPYSDRDPVIDSGEEDGEDLEETARRDYRAIPALDTLAREDVDDRDFEDLTFEQRAAADKEIREREIRRARIEGRLPRAFEEEDFEPISKRRRREELTEQELDIEMPLEELQDATPAFLRDHLETDKIRREVRIRFCNFLRKFVDASGTPIYREKIRRMCENNEQSLEVSYLDLSVSESVLALWVADIPSKMLEVFNEGAMEVVLQMFEHYKSIHEDVFVRIADLPVSDRLRDIRSVLSHPPLSPAGKSILGCSSRCGFVLGPFYQTSWHEIQIGSCPECQSKGPFNVNQERTLYRNYQKITLQETPGTVPAGRLPRHKDVILLSDLIDAARPGEEIEVTGLYTNNFDAALNTKNGFPVFATVIEANHILKKADEFSAVKLNSHEEKELLELAKRPNIADDVRCVANFSDLSQVIKSIAPSIWGHEDVKTALALAIFGGQPKDVGGKHRIRGDINVLALGDPGTAKSQLLKYVETTAHRAVFTTGKGASAVGLTAAVHKDPVTREWTLEGGALVLADTGVCIIDEFDKMSDQDRTSIHEAMEQQSISISKAGIVTSLQARCSVIAAANPKGGRYNTSLPFNENVDLTEPILSRFDVLCVVKDVVDPILDHQLASFVVNSHVQSHPAVVKDANAAEDRVEGPISQDQLRKYIMYAKQHCHPQLRDVDMDKVAALYAELRHESQAGGGIPVAIRHVESIVRMSEAYARMHLRDDVRDDDVDFAIRVMLESFIGSQKYSVQRSLQRTFHRYIAYNRDNDELLFYLLQRMVRDEISFTRSRDMLRLSTNDSVEIDKDEFELRARDLRIHDLTAFYKGKLFVSNFNLDNKRAKIVRRA